MRRLLITAVFGTAFVSAGCSALATCDQVSANSCTPGLVRLIAAGEAGFIDRRVRLSDEQFRPKPADSPVELINADTLNRNALQQLLDDHLVIARFEVSTANIKEILQGGRLEQAFAHVRRLGGDVLLTTRNSVLIGVIFRDTRYAGPPDADETMYALRRRVPEPPSTFLRTSSRS